MYYFDQGAEITPEEILARVEKRLAEGKDYILLTHLSYRNLPGKMFPPRRIFPYRKRNWQKSR